MSQEREDKPQNQDKGQDIKGLTQERDEYLDGWKRAKADLANYKKEELKRIEEIARFANEDIIRDILSVLDSFDLALQTIKEGDKAEKGIYLIRSQLVNLLKKRGLERITIKEGERFDPSLHEAVMTTEGTKEQDGLVAQEIEAGYTLQGKVIRPTKVKVYTIKEN